MGGGWALCSPSAGKPSGPGRLLGDVCPARPMDMPARPTERLWPWTPSVCPWFPSVPSPPLSFQPGPPGASHPTPAALESGRGPLTSRPGTQHPRLLLRSSVWNPGGGRGAAPGHTLLPGPRTRRAGRVGPPGPLPLLLVEKFYLSHQSGINTHLRNRHTSRGAVDSTSSTASPSGSGERTAPTRAASQTTSRVSRSSKDKHAPWTQAPVRRLSCGRGAERGTAGASSHLSARPSYGVEARP